MLLLLLGAATTLPCVGFLMADAGSSSPLAVFSSTVSTLTNTRSPAGFTVLNYGHAQECQRQCAPCQSVGAPRCEREAHVHLGWHGSRCPDDRVDPPAGTLHAILHHRGGG